MTAKTSSKIAGFKAILAEAGEAADAAFLAASPVPMHVVERANPLDDSSPIIRAYAPVMDGPCGFASVILRPGTSGFARFCAKEELGHKAYYGGFEFSMFKVCAEGRYSQSYERKMAGARAFAAVLQKHGYDAYPDGRLD